MSFSEQVKNELCRTPVKSKCCARAELYGVFLFCNTFTGAGVRIITEHTAFAQRLPQLLHRAFRMRFDRLPEGQSKHSFAITDPDKMAQIHKELGGSPALAIHLNFAVVEEDCCRTAFFRGAFLAGGSVTDPKKGYHLEFVTSHHSASREMQALMHEADFSPKLSMRKGNAVIYFKHSDKVEDVLTAVGAPISAMEVMNAKLEKDIRGSVNRRVNCDAANLDKSVEAAITQAEAIRRLQASGMLAGLPERLQYTAQLRLDYGEDTLSQLAQRCDPPITKSALNHRLRKLVELACEL